MQMAPNNKITGFEDNSGKATNLEILNCTLKAKSARCCPNFKTLTPTDYQCLSHHRTTLNCTGNATVGASVHQIWTMLSPVSILSTLPHASA